MDFRLLRSFVTVVRLGSLTRAAERLYLAQPTLTVHIRQLEEQLGYPLFERTHKRAILTPAGQRFLPYAHRLLAGLDDALEDLTAWSQGYTSRLHVTASPLISASVLPGLLREYNRLHPEVEIAVTVQHSWEIGRAVLAGEADIGLSRMQPAERDLTVHPLYRDPLRLVAPPRDDDGDVLQRPYTQLLGRHLLFTYNHPEFWDDLILALRHRGLRLRTLSVSQVNITKRFIEEGLGVSFLPESTVPQELAEGKVVVVPTPDLPLPLTYTYSVIRRGDGGAGAVGRFVALLERRFATPGTEA